MNPAYIFLVVVWSLSLPCIPADKVYRQDGDLVVGGIIPVHFFDYATRRCKDLRDISALRRVEAVRYAVSVINEDDSLLGNIALGYEIYDSCSSTVKTLEHTLEFIPELRRVNNKSDNVIGVVGPQRSANSVQATTLLGLYNITAVSFLSTSDELSDSDRFPYFIRTVPPDKYQVSVITDLLKEHQWEYVAFVYSDDTYGNNAEGEFRDQAGRNGICIGYSRSISGTDDANVYKEVIEDLLALRGDTLVSVVVLFTLLETAAKVFEHATSANIDRDFIWIGSDGWGNYDLSPVQDAEDSALGAFTVVPRAKIHQGFNEFFQTIRCKGPTSNPWLSEYCQACNYSDSDIQKMKLPPYESLVIDSVYVIARGLEEMRSLVCNENQSKAECVRTLVGNRRLLRDLLLNVSFTSDSNGQVSFARNGDSMGRYDIRYLVKNGTDYHFITRGEWLQYTSPELHLEPISWYLKDEPNRKTFTEENVPKSICSDPCGPSQVIMADAKQDCCWKCDDCEDNEIIVENACHSCFFEANQTYMWPDPSLTHCNPLTELRLVHEIHNVILLVLAVVGIMIEIVVAFLYIKNRNEKLIRASSRELCYIILGGVLLAYSSAILYCTPAHIVSCYARRVVPSVATTLIYMSLLTMTVRLYRIFTAGLRTTKRPHFISPMSQVALTLTVSTIPLTWGLVWIYLEPPAATVIAPTSEHQVIEKMCRDSEEHRIGQLAWEVAIVLLNCYFAIRTRNLPANYNQTRFIAFSVFSTLIVIIAFAPAFFAADLYRHQDLYNALGYIIQPTVVLTLIFITKIYAVYFVAEEDQNILSDRPSMRDSSEVVRPPSPPLTISTTVLNVSLPPTPGVCSARNFSDSLAQTEADFEIGPPIFKSLSVQLNADAISNDSIEIHSIKEGEMQQKETETEK